jgi:hypothetical protein
MKNLELSVSEFYTFANKRAEFEGLLEVRKPIRIVQRVRMHKKLRIALVYVTICRTATILLIRRILMLHFCIDKQRINMRKIF